jgi:hypothetical protein
MRRSRRSTHTSMARYSNETDCHLTTWPTIAGAQTNMRLVVVPSTPVYGMRRCRNFEINLSLPPGSPDAIAWALIYVPEGIGADQVVLRPFGTQPGDFNSLYEPNQHVITSGVLTAEQPVKSFTPVSRNLNSGDAIWIVMAAAASPKFGPRMYITLPFCHVSIITSPFE